MIKNINNYSKEELKKRSKAVWTYLNKQGIYTEAQLDVAIAAQEKLDIGIFVSPIPGITEEAI